MNWKCIKTPEIINLIENNPEVFLPLKSLRDAFSLYIFGYRVDDGRLYNLSWYNDLDHFKNHAHQEVFLADLEKFIAPKQKLIEPKQIVAHKDIDQQRSMIDRDNVGIQEATRLFIKPAHQPVITVEPDYSELYRAIRLDYRRPGIKTLLED